MTTFLPFSAVSRPVALPWLEPRVPFPTPCRWQSSVEAHQCHRQRSRTELQSAMRSHIKPGFPSAGWRDTIVRASKLVETHLIDSELYGAAMTHKRCESLGACFLSKTRSRLIFWSGSEGRCRHDGRVVKAAVLNLSRAASFVSVGSNPARGECFFCCEAGVRFLVWSHL